jgi:ATP-dependent helicase HrpB
MSGDSDSWPKFTDDEIVAALRDFVGGMNKWSDIAELDITLAIDSILRSGGHDRREVDRLAPERIEVPSGSKILVRYDGDEPTMEVRLQECFGLMASPRVVMGRVPVVMTLLSPAHRPIQVTKDLSGFWTGAYSLVRKDMRGRYPKHNWPEDPLSAVASRRTLK